MKGFTLIEVLVVMAITVMMAGLLVTHFSRSSVDLTQTRAQVQDAIREAQSLTLSGALYRGSYRCGYGVHFETNRYTIYAAPDAEDVDCSLEDRNYNAGDDDVVRVGIISNPAITIGAAPDIFFEPPKPTVYFDDATSPNESVDIEITRGESAQCPSDDCRIINVTTSGVITSQ